MSHSLKQTSSPTVGREQDGRKEGKVCSADLSLRPTCKIELGHKALTLLVKKKWSPCPPHNEGIEDWLFGQLSVWLYFRMQLQA